MAWSLPILFLFISREHSYTPAMTLTIGPLGSKPNHTSAPLGILSGVLLVDSSENQ